MSTAWRRAGLLIVVILLDAGCAAHWAYRGGQSEAKKGNWDLAVARLTKALAKSPDNITYKIALENARIQASRFHYDEARKHLAAEELEQAAEELQVASNYDPSNRSAADDLELVKERIRKRDEQRQRLTDFDAMKARAQATRVPVPVLSPRSPVPITLKFANQSLQKILESLGKLAGVNIIFDSDFRDSPNKSVELTGVTFEEALNQITFTNRLFYKVVDENTVIIVQESPAKRKAYDENLVQTFYLQNAEVNETLQLIKSLAGIQKAAGNVSLGAITVMGTPDELAVAQRIIDTNDKAKGEVVVEVQILEVNRNKLKQYGIEFANSDYSASVLFSPTGAANEGSGGVTSVRAQLLSSLNLADFVVSVPSTLLTRFLQTDTNGRVLASPRLRAAEGKKTALKIGQEVPVPVTTFQATQTGGQTFTPATSFQYRNVGVNLELTPKVSVSGDISLEIAFEFSGTGTPAALAGQTLPTFTTRNVNGILRLRDGQTSLIGGLIQGNDTTTLRGVLGLQSLPILNRIFTATDRKVDQTEILISITPHIVRAPKVTDDDLAALYVGTKENFRVPSARPSLFADSPPQPTTAPIAGAAPLAPPASGTGATGPAPGPQPRPTAPPQAPIAPPLPQATPAPPLGAQPPAGEVPPGGAAATEASQAPNAEPSAARAVFSPSQVHFRVGESASVSLVVVGARGLTGVDASVTFDGTQLQVTDVAPGNLLTLDGASVGAERRLETGRASGHFTRADPTTGSGAVVVFKFQAMSPGRATLSVDALTLATAAGTEAVVPQGTAILTVEP